MAYFKPQFPTKPYQEGIPGRAAFLAFRPDINIVYAEKRRPGTLFAYYNPANGFAELYIVDPSGHKFMPLG